MRLPILVEQGHTHVEDDSAVIGGEFDAVATDLVGSSMNRDPHVVQSFKCFGKLKVFHFDFARFSAIRLLRVRQADMASIRDSSHQDRSAARGRLRTYV